MKKYFVIVLLIWSYSLLAKDVESCQEQATTQLEMNKCAGLNYENIKTELDSVIAKINSRYKDDMIFLEKLSKSQDAWLFQLELDLEMKYPSGNKQGHSGSVYPLCSNDYRVELMKIRIKFLKQWLQNPNEGDVCLGSVKHK